MMYLKKELQSGCVFLCLFCFHEGPKEKPYKDGSLEAQVALAKSAWQWESQVDFRCRLRPARQEPLQKASGSLLGPQMVVQLLLCLPQLRQEPAPGPSGKPRRFQECHMNCSWGSVPGFVLSRLWPGPWVVILPSKPCPGGNLQTASQLCSRQSAAVVPPGQQIRFPPECTFIHGVLCVSRGSQWAEWQR